MPSCTNRTHAMMFVSAFHPCRLRGWREQASNMSTSTPSLWRARNEASSKSTLKTTWAPAARPIDPSSAIRRDHPVSLHGVCMSIGGPQALDNAHLARFKTLVERYEPALVSEHL